MVGVYPMSTKNPGSIAETGAEMLFRGSKTDALTGKLPSRWLRASPFIGICWPLRFASLLGRPWRVWRCD